MHFNLCILYLHLTVQGRAGTKYKFLSENEGDKLQIEKFYRACKGLSQVNTLSFFNLYLFFPYFMLTTSLAYDQRDRE